MVRIKFVNFIFKIYSCLYLNECGINLNVRILILIFKLNFCLYMYICFVLNRLLI